MTEEQINIRISKALGYDAAEDMLNYCQDLDAIWSAWNDYFGFYSEEWLIAYRELVKVVMSDIGDDDAECPYVLAAVANASAKQRAEAFNISLDL